MMVEKGRPELKAARTLGCVWPDSPPWQLRTGADFQRLGADFFLLLFLRRARALYNSARAWTSDFVASPIWMWSPACEPPQPRGANGTSRAKVNRRRRFRRWSSVTSDLPVK